MPQVIVLPPEREGLPPPVRFSLTPRELMAVVEMARGYLGATNGATSFERSLHNDLKEAALAYPDGVDRGAGD